jgi:hypothetical protein
VDIILLTKNAQLAANSRTAPLVIGKKHGRIGKELKQLVQQGTITPQTFVEDPTGRTGLAKDVNGLTFPELTLAVESPSVDNPSTVAPFPVSQPVQVPCNGRQHENRVGRIDIADGNRKRTRIVGEIWLHSDRGVQFSSEMFRDILELVGIEQSMSRKGNCWDNAPCESWFGKLKTEWIYPNGVYKTRREAELSIIEYIEMP